MKETRFPDGWSEDRVRHVLTHYESQTEQEAAAEDEGAVAPADLTTVYILWHVHKFEDSSEDEKCIGVYRTRESADAAAARLRDQPGFRDAPDGFIVDAYQLDLDHWTEGYDTLYHR